MKPCYRPEHPRPQFQRESWLNLNGPWDFVFDFGNSGIERKLFETEVFDKEDVKTIHVPFCPESRLSGIAHVDWMNAVWYRRTVTLTSAQTAGRVLLHFGAVDYHAAVWVNGQKAGEHIGGYTPFTLDVTELVTAGDNVLTVYAEDDNRSGKQPLGKQCPRYASSACDYTRTTGIWQTVWMEFVPKDYITYTKITPLVSQQAVLVECEVSGGRHLVARASFAGEPMGEITVPVENRRATLYLPLKALHLWEVGDGKLYDLTLTLDGTDRVESYFGMRTVTWEKDGLYLNGRPLFMRTILDQGYYPDGIYTAPSDDDLRGDIEMAISLGFNGARFHQKVFEERSLYWADRLGYIVWDEYPLHGATKHGAKVLEVIYPQWEETVRRDYSHPCVVGWCPDNEVYWERTLDPELQKLYYRLTKTLDPTRPCIDASGGTHFDTDFFDVHEYTQSPDDMRRLLAPMKEDAKVIHDPQHNPACPWRSPYNGQPYWVSEFGGTAWAVNREDGWGYGGVADENDFAARYEGLASALLEHPRVCGFCYTQLTDIEQEQNGLFQYDRSKKFSDTVYQRIREANLAVAAIEKAED